MQTYYSVRSTADVVEPLEINEESVIVRTGIKRVTVPGDEMTDSHEEWEIEKEEIYEKNEYIHHVSEQNSTLESTLDSILTEVIPSMML